MIARYKPGDIHVGKYLKGIVIQKGGSKFKKVARVMPAYENPDKELKELNKVMHEKQLKKSR